MSSYPLVPTDPPSTARLLHLACIVSFAAGGRLPDVMHEAIMGESGILTSFLQPFE